MDKKRTARIGIIVLASVLGAILLYGIICCCITFIPMIHMAVVDAKATGNVSEPTATISLDNGVKLYAFTSASVKDKYVLVCPGGGYTGCEVQREGFAVATELNRLGYAAFVLEYRTGKQIKSAKAPLDDVADAIRYIDENAKQYHVYKGHYILCGFSAGGNLIGLFGTKQFGYANYEDVAKPDALIMGYPWCNPSKAQFNGNIADYAYYASLNGNGAKAFLQSKDNYDEMQVALWVDEDYPRTFIMHGDNDVVAPAEEHSDVLASALTAKGVEYKYNKYEGVVHGCGIGLGTKAEGWLGEAMNYCYENWYEEEYAADPYTCEELKDKMGGYMCGVCHPNERFDQMAELGSDWARFDLTSVPLDADGNETVGYVQFKERAKMYVDKGFKVFCVTPMPNVWISAGLDPRDKDNERKIMEQLRYMTVDLQGLVGAFQIMNEQTEGIFRTPLTLEEAAEFTGFTLKVMNRFKGDAVVGYNVSANFFTEFLNELKAYNQYTDYIGIDIYLGCFESMTHSLSFLPASGWAWYVWTTTHRPVIMTEFGYISAGEPKSEEEKLAILHQYGAQGDTFAEAEEWARTHITEFLENENFPAALRNYVRLQCGSDEAAAIGLFGGEGAGVDYSAHMYRELGENVNVEGYPHSLQGQADFFTDYFDKFVLKCDYVVGAILYCLNDAEACGYCSQSDCPVETRWGLLTVDGEKKPSFYAIKEAFEKCKAMGQEDEEDEEDEFDD